MTRLTLTFLTLLLLASCGYGPVTGPRRFDPANEPTLVPTSAAVAAPVYTIQEGAVAERVTFEARISPRAEGIALAPIDGTILNVEVEVGDLVVAGDRLARYDFGSQEAEIEQLQVELAEVQRMLDTAAANLAAQLGRAELELDLAKVEYDVAVESAGAAPTAAQTQQLDLLQRKIELAELDLVQLNQAIDPDGEIEEQMSQLQAQIELLENQQGERGLVAPVDGVVLGLSVRNGSRVSAEEPVAVIGKMGGAEDVSLSAVLRSDLLERLAQGMPVEIRFNDQADQPVAGSIVRLPYPYNSGGNELGFDEADNAVRILPTDSAVLDQLQVGALAEVSLTLDQNDFALWLPPEAVREFNGRSFVVVKNGSREQRVDVAVGLRGNGRVEVIGNVSAGQEVIGP